MPLTIQDFNMPDRHPFGMLEGQKHACEKEGFLAWMLKQSIERGGFIGIETKANEDSFAEDGYLEKVGPQTYKLSQKSIALLYVHYGKKG